MLDIKGPLFRAVAGILAALVLAVPLRAGAQVPAPVGPYSPAQPLFAPFELDRLVAPIALYPDALLGNVLMASTYPFEVVQAARWARDPRYGALDGEALRAVLAERDWAPSVKSLIPFPQVLQMMDSNLEWLQTLGDAFLTQPDDVMDAVQRLRRRALAAGVLANMGRYLIIVTGPVITIEFASRDLVYVPYYDPTLVYGAWPYPAYPPYYFVPPPSYYVGVAVRPGFYFFAGPVRIVRWLWDWYRWDWRRHRIDLVLPRFNVINVRRPAVARAVWQHDYHHRRGVPYPTPALRERYLPRVPNAVERRLEYRGYEPGQRPAVTPRVREVPERTVVPRAIPRSAPSAQAPDRTAPRVLPPAPRSERPRTVVPRSAPPVTVPRQVQPAQRAAPAFQGYTSRDEARREAERGRESRQAAPRVRPEVRKKAQPAPKAEPRTRTRQPADDSEDSQPRSERFRR